MSYIIALLTGRALAWATAVAERRAPAPFDSAVFMEKFWLTFDHRVSGHEAATRLLRLRQGNRCVADYAVEFRSLAIESGWTAEALVPAFHEGLSESIKDELAAREDVKGLDALIDVAIRMDKRLQERRRQRRQRLEPEQHINSGITHTRTAMPVLRRMGPLPQSMPPPYGKSQRSSAIGGGLVSVCVFSTNISTRFKLPVTVSWGGSSHSASAFIDSGAAGDFIDGAWARQHGIPLWDLEQPPPITALDGQALGTGSVNLISAPVRLQTVLNHHEVVQFHVISSPDLPIILGYPWLARHNPSLCWTTGTLLAWETLSYYLPPQPVSTGHSGTGAPS